MWQDKLKEAGINVHVISTGGGAGVQQLLWEVPGSSAYLSGASFPYAAEEQEELLGFMPEHFCSEDAAIDLASAAYMKAYKFGGKKPVGVGITASVASEKEHRGDHRVFTCVISDVKVALNSHTLTKGVGSEKRLEDGVWCDEAGICAILESHSKPGHYLHSLMFEDAAERAKARFFARPFFAANGKRFATLTESNRWAIMPGAYNPPHEGHFGTAKQVGEDYGNQVVFEVTAEPPHKDALSVQDLLKRSKLLQGTNRIFTRKAPFYIDKARAFPGCPLVMGADAMVRMLDPKWGLNLVEVFEEFEERDVMLYIGGRTVDGKFMTRDDITEIVSPDLKKLFISQTRPVRGHWDISSTELRNKLL
jgi:hypothetical protein